jgi:hypothetical protein
MIDIMAWPLPRQGKNYHLITLGLESIPVDFYGRVPGRIMERVLNEESTTLRQDHVLPEESGTVSWIRSDADNLTTG